MKHIKSITLIIGILAMFVLSGCAMTYTVVPSKTWINADVDSIAVTSPDLKSKTYTLTSAMKNISPKDIQFREFAAYVNHMLAKKGYKLVNSNADLLIRMAYGIGKPKTEVSSKTYVTSDGYSYPITDWYWVNVPPTTEMVVTKKTTYNRFLMLEAYNVKDQSQLWRTTVKSEGSGSDFRVVFPSLLAVAAERLGKNIVGKTNVNVFTNSSYVLEVMPDADKGGIVENRLGVRLKDVSPEDKCPLADYPDDKVGVRVLEVYEGGVAERMGIQQYDIITAVNNTLGYKLSDLLEEIKDINPGGEVRITYYDWTKYETVVKIDYLR